MSRPSAEATSHAILTDCSARRRVGAAQARSLNKERRPKRRLMLHRAGDVGPDRVKNMSGKTSLLGIGQWKVSIPLLAPVMAITFPPMPLLRSLHPRLARRAFMVEVARRWGFNLAPSRPRRASTGPRVIAIRKSSQPRCPPSRTFCVYTDVGIPNIAASTPTTQFVRTKLGLGAHPNAYQFVMTAWRRVAEDRRRSTPALRCRTRPPGPSHVVPRLTTLSRVKR